MNQSSSDIYYHGPVVVFDLDDTLYSEREHALSAYREVCMMPDLCSPSVSRAAYATMRDALDEGRNPFDVLAAMLADRGIATVATTERRLAVYRRHRPKQLTLYPDALAALDMLRDAGVKCAIVTDGRPLTQRAKIAALGIADRFHPADIRISGETGHDKNEPDNFIDIVHHYPEASRFIYIGDNPAKDFDIPAMLGWDVYCLAARPGNIHPQSAPSDAEMVETLTEVAEKVCNTPHISSI